MALRLRPGRAARLSAGPTSAPAADEKQPAPREETREISATSKPTERPELLTEVLIEEVSIDGMCGVY